MEGNLGQKESYAYDAQGNLISVTDAMGNTTKREYDRNGNLCAVTDAAGTRTLYAYDAMDRLIRVCMGGTDLCTYERDHAGNILAETDALGRSTYYGYDLLGRAVLKKDRDGYETRYRYTPSGKREEILYGDGRRAQYHYDAAGNLTGVEDWNGTTTFINDALGRVVQTIYPGGESVSCRYGRRGERTGLVYPDGTEAEYRYGKGQRLEELLTRTGEGAQESIRYRYDEKGRLAEKELPNGVHTFYYHTKAGQLESMESKIEGKPLEKIRMSYDCMGNRIGIERFREGMSEESGKEEYLYDILGRLKEVRKDGSLQHKYEYDVRGNRIRKEEWSNQKKRVTLYKYNNANELICEQSEGQDICYQYDGRGNMIQMQEGHTIRKTFRYGSTNRLEEAVDFIEQRKVQYGYHALGQRIRRIEVNESQEETQTEYLTDLMAKANNLLGLKSEKTNNWYLWDGRAAVQIGEKGKSYYLTDEVGSPLRFLDEKGKTIGRYAYDEFGNEKIVEETLYQPFGYTGYQPDAVTGTYFAQAREYLPTQGRFAAEDILGGDVEMPDSLNAYVYCYNSPKNYIDENGESITIATRIVSAVVNALWNVLSYLVEAYIAGDEIEGKRIMQEAAYGAICGVFGHIDKKWLKDGLGIAMDIANTLYKELVIEEKEFSSQMIGKVVLNAIENYLVSALWNRKCGDDKIYKEVRNNVKNKTDSAEATLREVKKETKDVMGKQFKKLQKKIYKADEELFWDSVLDFTKKENLYVAENTILWKRVKKSTMKQLRKSVREDIIMNGGCPA